MKFTDVFIKRPVFATTLSLLLLFVGFIAIKKMPLRQYPDIQPPVISVQTAYPGASAKMIEGFITTPIESALSDISGVDYISSSSTAGNSQVLVNLRLGHDLNQAVVDVGDKVDAIRGSLPSDAYDPVISKFNPEATATLYIAFSSDTLSAEAVTDYITRVVQPQLEVLPGVGRAQILGAAKYAMRIWLDPAKMAAQNVTAADVSNMLASNNLQTAAGRLESTYQEFDLSAKTDIETAAQFNNMVVKTEGNSLIRVSDIGKAVLGAQSRRASAIMNDYKANVIGVFTKSTGNPLSVAKAGIKQLEKIKAHLPSDIKAYLIWDNSKFIAASIHEVIMTILEAATIILLLIFLCLGSFRAILIPIVTIPLSLIGVCGLMLLMGFAINTLTLLAAVLAIGLVVDDAIVVVENIHRHLEKGESPMQAALIGTREIARAVIVMTITLAAVFMPIAFMTGLTGKLFTEFAFALAGAVLVSGFVALTLSPMMCSKLLTNELFHRPFPQAIDRVFTKITQYYRSALSKLLFRKPKQLSIIAICLVLGIALLDQLLFTTTQEELAPAEDQGVVLTIAISPNSTNLNYLEKYTKQLIPIFKSIPEMENYGIINGFDGVHKAIAFLVLKPWGDRKRSAQDIIQSLFPKFAAIKGILAFPFNFPSLPGGDIQGNVGFVVKTTGTFQELNSVMQQLEAKVRQNPKFVNVQNSLSINKPQVDISINRALAGDLGISMQDISTALNVSFAEPVPSHFTMAGRRYDVIPQLMAQYRNSPDKLKYIEVRTSSGKLIPLSSLITVTESVVPPSLDHFQQMRSATLHAATAPGYSLGEALEFLQQVSKEVLPDDMNYDYVGESRQYIEAAGTTAMLFLSAIILILLVLAAQFESFVDAFIVLVAILFSFLGAIVAIRLTGATLNIYTKIGLVALIGLISKHGILMIEFCNQLRKEGRDRVNGILEAATVRLRPILMTTGAMVLGALPLVFASGAGAVSRHQLGSVIVGGMTIGTMFTLFVVPMVYISVHRLVATMKR